MFQRNDQYQQTAMFSSIYELPEKQLKRLKGSWVGTFYREFFRRVEEALKNAFGLFCDFLQSRI